MFSLLFFVFCLFDNVIFNLFFCIKELYMINETSNLPMNDQEYEEYMKLSNKDKSIDEIDLECSNLPDSFFDNAVKIFESYNMYEK